MTKTDRKRYTLRQLVQHISVLGGISVGVAAAVITAKASHDVAVATQFVTNHKLAWAIPLGVEGGSITFASLAWDAASRGHNAWKYRLGLLFFMAMSIAMNVFHVHGKSDFAVVEAFFFPIALVLVVEALLGTQRTKEKHRRQQASRTVAKAVQTPTVARTPVTSTKVPQEVGSPSIEQAAPKARKGSVHDATVAGLLADNPAIKGTEVAEIIGVSPQHGRRLLANARQAGEQ